MLKARTESQAPEPLMSGHVLEERWFLRPNDFDRLAGIAPTTVRDAIYRGELRARKFRGRGWLITVEDARRWIEEQTTPNDSVHGRTA